MPDIIELANQFRAALLKNERAAAARMVEAYGKIYNRLSKDLAALTKQIKEAQARGEVVNQAWLLRQRRYAELLGQVDEQFKRFADLADTTITKQQSKAVKAALGDSVALMEAAAAEFGMSATFNRLPTAAVENLVGFLGDGSPLKALLDELPRSAGAIVSKGLLQGVALGRNPTAIAREIRAGLGGNMVRALTVSRTEVLRAYRTASHQTYRENSDVVRGWYWRSSRSRRCCASCCAMDGTFHPVTEPMKSHPRCRCVQVPGVKGVQVDRGADWFDEQPADVQRDILGTNAGYKAYKTGELKLTDFVGLRRDPRWGGSYYQLSVKRARAGEGAFPRGTVPPPVPPPPATPSPPPAPPKKAPKRRAAPKPKTPPPPAQAPVPAGPQPAGKPVRDGLKLPARGNILKNGNHTLAAIEKVHGDGVLPQIPVQAEKSQKRLGGYWYYNTNPPRALKITIKQQGGPELTLAHEIGHFLDQQGAGKGLDHASVADSLFDEFRREASNSQAIKRLQAALPTAGRDRRYVQYLLDMKEIWARSYAQYITLRSGDALLKRQLDDVRLNTGSVLPFQWEDNDFAPIADAIDRIMLRLGWRK